MERSLTEGSEEIVQTPSRATNDARAYTSFPRAQDRPDAIRRVHEAPFAYLVRDRPGPRTLVIRVTSASVEAGSSCRKRSFELHRNPHILGLLPGTRTVLLKS